MGKFKTFVAYAKTREGKPDIRITSVVEEDPDSARKEIRRQLQKPGREAYLNRWIEDGEVIGIVS